MHPVAGPDHPVRTGDHPIVSRAVAPDDEVLDRDTVLRTLAAGLGDRFDGDRVLVLLPDHTRSAPLPFFFAALTELLGGASQLDFMVALGTHPPLSEAQLRDLVGITVDQRETTYARVGLSNHAWTESEALTSIGTLTRDRLQEIAGERWHPSLGGDVPVRVNRHALGYDHLVVLGPTFPHEVAGYSGGAKYLFPGISGPEMIDVSHWLGALCGVVDTIGTAETPVRRMIDDAAGHLTVPTTLVSMVVVDDADLAAVFVGGLTDAWRAATEISARRHIVWVDTPFRRVLSTALPRYDELWTAAKAAYKLQPVLAPGAELIIHAPRLHRVSDAHGHHIERVGYHVLEYFLDQWGAFEDIPRAVLAHSTHVRGAGSFENGMERAHASVALASQIPKADCERLGLGYVDPSTIDPGQWAGREDEGVLYVPRAGELLYRVRP